MGIDSRLNVRQLLRMSDHSESLPPGRIPIIGEEKIADPKLVAGQKALVEQIKAEAAEQQANREATELANKITPPSASELEKQRNFAVQLDAMVCKRLEEGAKSLEKLVCAQLRQGPAADISRAHLMMEQAKSLRIAMEFIKNG
jgi:hypothetical protein